MTPVPQGVAYSVSMKAITVKCLTDLRAKDWTLYILASLRERLRSKQSNKEPSHQVRLPSHRVSSQRPYLVNNYPLYCPNLKLSIFGVSSHTLSLLVRGLLTYLPGWENRFSIGTGGTVSARDCYSVWLRHLALAYEHGLIQGLPAAVAELGPGSSLGIGLAALISGSQSYTALDVVRSATGQANLRIFDELIGLFQQKADIPGPDEFPNIKPALQHLHFPSAILSEGHLEKCLAPDRLTALRAALTQVSSDESLVSRSNVGLSPIVYRVPWYDKGVIVESSLDMIFSQAVLEHVDDLPHTYQALYRWLRPGGFMSHQIDFTCHGTAQDWNGHWTIPDFTWKIMRGRRPYMLNRQPHSTHLNFIQSNHFKIAFDASLTKPSAIRRENLAPGFKFLSDEDLSTSGAFMQAVRPDR